MTWSEQTREMLVQAGWMPGRRVPVDHILQIIQDENDYRSTETFVQFISEFQGIEVKFINAGGYKDNVLIDFIAANKVEFAETVYAYAKRIGKELLPLGKTNNNLLLLMMAPDGSVYAAFESYLAFVATTGAALFEVLLLDDREKRIRTIP